MSADNHGLVVLSRSEAGSNSQPRGAPERAAPSDTLRVKRIPKNLDTELLKDEIKKDFHADPKICSLEPFNDRHHCATVTFPGRQPKFPSEALRERELECEREGKDVGGEYRLVYDTDFMGITPLFDARAEAMVE